MTQLEQVLDYIRNEVKETHHEIYKLQAKLEAYHAVKCVLEKAIDEQKAQEKTNVAQILSQIPS